MSISHGLAPWTIIFRPPGLHSFAFIRGECFCCSLRDLCVLCVSAVGERAHTLVSVATVLGVISDTHGLLRPEAVDALRGSAAILHAGDIGAPEVLDALAKIAPVYAVRGNVDLEAWAAKLPVRRTLHFEQAAVHLLHDIGALRASDLKTATAVIYGHSHRPSLEERNGVLFLNPGSAGPVRFHLPVSVARLVVDGAKVSAAIIELSV